MAVAYSGVDDSGSLTDRALVEAHQAGDRDAFTEIVRRHYRALFAQALRSLGSPAEAEDAVQEAFERSYRSLDAFGGDYRLRSWLGRIVANVCADHGGRRIAETRMAERMIGWDGPSRDATEGISDPVVLHAVLAALDALPGTQRNSFLLREIGGLSYLQVAQDLGISEDNARARVHRAKSTLRRSLGDFRSLLGGLVGLPVGIRQFAHRASPAGISPVGSSTPMTMSGVMPVSTTSLMNVATSAPAASGVLSSSVASQIVTQLSGPLGQAALSVAPVVSRGVIAAGLALGLASTFSGYSAAAQPAPVPAAVTAALTASVGPDAAQPSTPVVSVAPTNVQDPTTANVASATSVPVVSTPTTVAPPTAVAAATPPSAPSSASVPDWVSAASGTAVGATGSSGSATSGSTTSGQSSTTPVSGAPVPVTTSCPWASEFPGASPGYVASTDPLSGTMVAQLTTGWLPLASTGPNPDFNSAATLRQTNGGASVPLNVLTGACLAPSDPLLVSDLSVGTGAIQVQLRGALVTTLGGDGTTGYLYRGTVVPLGGDSASALPWGLPQYFVAELQQAEPGNTVDLSIAFFTAGSPASNPDGSSGGTAGTTPGSGAAGETGDVPPVVPGPAPDPTSAAPTVAVPAPTSGSDPSVGDSPSAGSVSTRSASAGNAPPSGQ